VLQDDKRGICYRDNRRVIITVRRMHHYRTVTITVSDHTLTSAIQLEITSKSCYIPWGCCGNALDVENQTRMVARCECQPGRALSSLLFALKAKINYGIPALLRYVNGRCTCTGRTCVRISYVESRAPREMDYFAPRPLACKITFPLLSAARFDSFLYHQSRTLFDITLLR